MFKFSYVVCFGIEIVNNLPNFMFGLPLLLLLAQAILIVSVLLKMLMPCLGATCVQTKEPLIAKQTSHLFLKITEAVKTTTQTCTSLDSMSKELNPSPKLAGNPGLGKTIAVII